MNEKSRIYSVCCIGPSALTIIAGQKGYIIYVSAREKCEGSQEAMEKKGKPSAKPFI